MKKVELAPNYFISPVIKGGWQLSSGHSLNESTDPKQAIEDILAFVDAGISTLDFGDIYTGVEVIVGAALKILEERDGAGAREKVQLHTKYVPNESSLESYDPKDARATVLRSLARLGVQQVDLVQFHWWRYEVKHYLKALEELFQLKESGEIREVGVTNFDLTRLQEMVEAGLKPASIQLQYSVLDRRAEQGLLDYCLANGIGILCYGTVAGGFISERYLHSPEPTAFETRSSVKYKLIIDDFGGWELFQELLVCLHQIALAHQTDIATISSAFTLGRRGVSAVIVGARNLDHLQNNLLIPSIILSATEVAAIENIISKAPGPLGPVYGLERTSERHRNIMHTNNN